MIAGDGAGPEVIAEARKAVDALELGLEWVELPWGTAHYHEHGAMMPPDALDVVRRQSNASRYGYVLWDEVAAEVAAAHPGVRYERVLVDALAARMVRDPLSLDVVVASNLSATC